MNRKRFLDKFTLSGKVALVTGGSRGIGRVIALGLAEAGADIVLASRKLSDLEAVAQEISEMGRKAIPVSANVRHLAEIENLVKRAVDEFGHIDIQEYQLYIPFFQYFYGFKGIGATGLEIKHGTI